MTYSTLRCWIYEDVKKLSRKIRNAIFKEKMKEGQDITLVEKFIAGGLGGGIGAIVGNPFDVCKIRLINDIDKNKFNGLFD